VSEDLSELLLSKLIAIKAAAKLETLIGPGNIPAPTPNATTTTTLGSPEVPSRVNEVVALLRRALRHLHRIHGVRGGERVGDDDDDAMEEEDGRPRETQPLLTKESREENNDDVENGIGHQRQRRGSSNSTFAGVKHDHLTFRFEDAPVAFICASIVAWPYFDRVMDFMSIVSAVLLSLIRYDMEVPEQTINAISRINTFLTILFAIESYIKIRGLGWRRFRKDGMNMFDLGVVIIALAEMLVNGGGRYSTLRTVRLLRIFSLARGWKSFRQVLYNIAFTVGNSFPFLLLTAIFLFVYAIVGMTLLGESFHLGRDLF